VLGCRREAASLSIVAETDGPGTPPRGGRSDGFDQRIRKPIPIVVSAVFEKRPAGLK
jgi:hypothetical protein